MKDKNSSARKVIQIVTLAVLAAVTVVLCLYIARLYDSENMESFEELVESFGLWGMFFMFLLQVVQVVLAVIPGEPVELLMGALYGTFGGCMLCIVGIICGTALIYILVQRLGKNFVEKIIDSKQFKKLKFLKDPTKRDVLMFLLMFIPGTPKDLLTYFAPFTGISLMRILLISAVARIPSIVSSTYVGASFAEGNYLHSVIIFAVVGVISLAGILVYNKILADKNKLHFMSRRSLSDGTERQDSGDKDE